MHSANSQTALRMYPMVPPTFSRRSMLAPLAAMCGQILGCRNTSSIPLNTWARDPINEYGAESPSTIVLPTLGEAPRTLRNDFQQALCAQLRKSQLIALVDGGMSASETPCSHPNNMMTWDEQLANLGTVQAVQAIASKITYFEPTAPVKLGIKVLLIDAGTRATLRQVEGLWNAAQYQPCLPKKWLEKHVDEPQRNDNLCNISPKHLMEQAALEISMELQSIGAIDIATPNCSTIPETPPSQSPSVQRQPSDSNMTPPLKLRRAS